MIYNTMKVWTLSGEPLVINAVDYDPRLHSTKEDSPPKRDRDSDSAPSGSGGVQSTDSGSKDAKPDHGADASVESSKQSSKKARKKEVKAKSRVKV